MKYIFDPLKRAQDIFLKNQRLFKTFKPRVASRRSAKHPSVGKIYKNSRVVEGVGMDTLFTKPGWVKQAQFDRYGK